MGARPEPYNGRWHSASRLLIRTVLAMSERVRTFGAYLLLLVFGLGGAIAPHVHTAFHAAEVAATVQEHVDCDDAVHDLDGPVVSGHFHIVDAPDCTICATTHLFSAFVPKAGIAAPSFAKALSLLPDRTVPLIRALLLDIRGPPSEGA